MGYHKEKLPGLTEQQAEVVRLIASYWESHGYSPSMEDIGKQMRLTRERVRQHLRLLRRKGVVAYASGVPRSIRLVTP